LFKAIAEFRRAAGIHASLGDLGVTRAHLPELANNACLDPCKATNPALATVNDVEQIYEQAL